MVKKDILKNVKRIFPWKYISKLKFISIALFNIENRVFRLLHNKCTLFFHLRNR